MMGAVLHLAAACRAPTATALARPAVLSESFSATLAAMNRATRALKRLGYRIEANQLPLDIVGAKPEILLAPGQDMEALIELSRGLWFARDAVGRTAFTMLGEVTVSWREQP